MQTRQFYPDWIQYRPMITKTGSQDITIYGLKVLQVDTCDNVVKSWSETHEILKPVVAGLSS